MNPLLDEAIINSPVGFLRLTARGETLTHVDFLGPESTLSAPQTPILREAVTQFAAYFTDPHFQFSLPYLLEGTAFRRRVWGQIAAIPSGQVRTYADIAKALASAPRPVGGACGANPLPLIIPCHRVVAANGLGGFNARRGDRDWLPIKRWLLTHEHVI